MYNLRFYLDDDGNIIKCDYKRLSNSNEIDLMIYNEIKQNKNYLMKVYNTLKRNNLNHKYSERRNYHLHEFAVRSEVIKEMLSKMVNEHDNRKIMDNQQRIEEQKEINRKRRKYVLKRKNKFKRRVVTVSIVTLVALSTIVYGKIKSNNKNDLNEYVRQDSIVEMNLDEEVIDEDNLTIPEISNMIENINDNLQEENYENIVENNYNYLLELDAGDWTETQKYIDCYNNYYSVIEKYANMYGIDPKLALAIACHERGEHSDQIDDGGAIGLFQIQVDVWDGNDISAYNFETGEWETYTIELDNIKNIEDNVKAGIMIFQDCLIRDSYNIEMAVQEYNFGHGGLLNAIHAASDDLGVDINELETNGNTDWFNYRTANVTSDGYQMGDPNYVENVFKYINDNELLKFRTPDNEEINVQYSNLANKINKTM